MPEDFPEMRAELFREVVMSSPEARAKKQIGITAFDFLNLPENPSDDEILSWAAKQLSIKKQFLEDPKTKEEPRSRGSEYVYAQIRRSFSSAAAFLEHHHLREVYYRFPEQPDTIQDSRGLITFIRKASYFAKGTPQHDDISRAYCGMLKMALIYFDLEGIALAGAHDQMNFIDGIFSDPHTAHQLSKEPFAVVDKPRGSSPLRSFSYRVAGGEIQRGFVERRVKAEYRIVIKQAERPSADIADAIKDLCGYRFTLDKESIPGFVAEIVMWLRTELNVVDFTIENQALLNAREFHSIEEHIATRPADGKKNTRVKIIYELGKKNANTGGKGAHEFEAVKILCTIRIPPQYLGHAVSRSFEIQIVEPKNRNEKGALKHDTYEVSAFASAMTRIYGSCEVATIRKVALDVCGSQERADAVIKELMDSARIIERKAGSNRPVIITPRHVRRWAEHGVIPEDVAHDILHERKALRKHRHKKRQGK
jgi:hypothetical protein